MRIIQFRAWLKFKACMDSAWFIDWEHGLVGHSKHNQSDLDDCVLMQFTGLLDKNGKEIYEGDLILIDYLRDEKTKSVIEWYFSGWYAKSLEDPSKQVAGYGNLFNCKNIEIIGNIYENPELSNSQCKKQ